jgi:hypothetical protein
MYVLHLQGNTQKAERTTGFPHLAKQIYLATAKDIDIPNKSHHSHILFQVSTLIISTFPSVLTVALSAKSNLSTIVQRKKSVGGEKSMFSG